jgi:hypothetical protein
MSPWGGSDSEETANLISFSRGKQCCVSFKNSDGMEHSVEVEARTLYEAVGLALGRFRSCEHVKYEPAGEISVESREPATRHQLTEKLFDAWLERPWGIAQGRGFEEHSD